MSVSRFEYLSVLISIIIALGINEVLMSWGRLLRNRHKVRFYWPHAFWSALVLFLMIQLWWGFWNYRVVQHWSLFNLIITVLEAMTLVFCAMQLMPGRASAAGIDLRERYFDNCRPFFVLGSLTILQMVITDVSILGIPVMHPENYVRLVAICMSALLAWSPNPRLHETMPAVALLILATFLSYAIML